MEHLRFRRTLFFLERIATANESNVNDVSATVRAISLLEWQCRGPRGRRARRRRQHQKVRKADIASYGSRYCVRERYSFHHKKKRKKREKERQSIRLFHAIVMFRSCSRAPLSKKSPSVITFIDISIDIHMWSPEESISLTHLTSYIFLRRMHWFTCNFYLNGPSDVNNIKSDLQNV